MPGLQNGGNGLPYQHGAIYGNILRIHWEGRNCCLLGSLELASLLASVGMVGLSRKVYVKTRFHVVWC